MIFREIQPLFALIVKNSIFLFALQVMFTDIVEFDLQWNHLESE